MSTGQMDITCPNCKSEDCFYEVNCGTGEEYIQCSHCGYHHSFLYKRDEEGNFILKDISKGESLDNFVGVKTLVDKPFGTYKFIKKGNGSQWGTLATEDEFIKLKEEFKKMDKSDLKLFKLSRFINGKFKVTTLFKDIT